jgi:hypothetical protein
MTSNPSISLQAKHTDLLKAADSSTHEIVGLILVRWEDEVNLTPPDTVSSPSDDFITYYQPDTQASYLPPGKPHIDTSPFPPTIFIFLKQEIEKYLERYTQIQRDKVKA